MIVNDHLFYIHIPRTGGRCFKQMLPDNVEVPEFGKYYYKGIQPLHLHYPLYNEYFGVEDMEHFTIVRNPFDRFKSALKGPLEAFPSENPDTSYNYFFKKSIYFNYLTLFYFDIMIFCPVKRPLYPYK